MAKLCKMSHLESFVIFYTGNLDRCVIFSCPGLNANEIQIPYDNHHKVSSLVKRHQNTHNYVNYEVI